MKDGEFQEWGVRPVGRGTRTDLKSVLKHIKDDPTCGRMELMELYPDQMAKYPRFFDEYRNMQSKSVPLDYQDTPNIWIWGPPGVGKSRQYQDKEPYLKMANKWWDGYDQDEIALLEDWGPDQKCLGHHLKIWADRYPFLAEVKGTVIKIRPKQIVVTSNFRMEDIWDGQMLAALKRRFKIVHMDKPFGE